MPTGYPKSGKANITPDSLRRMSAGKKGKPVSDKTRALMSKAHSRPLGSYMFRWNLLYRLCALKGWRFVRGKNQWVVIDGIGKKHKFKNADGAVAFLQGGHNYERDILELVKGTLYRVVPVKGGYEIWNGSVRFSGLFPSSESVWKMLMEFKKIEERYK